MKRNCNVLYEICKQQKELSDHELLLHIILLNKGMEMVAMVAICKQFSFEVRKRKKNEEYGKEETTRERRKKNNNNVEMRTNKKKRCHYFD